MYLLAYSIKILVHSNYNNEIICIASLIFGTSGIYTVELFHLQLYMKPNDVFLVSFTLFLLNIFKYNYCGFYNI